MLDFPLFQDLEVMGTTTQDALCLWREYGQVNNHFKCCDGKTLCWWRHPCLATSLWYTTVCFYPCILIPPIFSFWFEQYIDSQKNAHSRKEEVRKKKYQVGQKMKMTEWVTPRVLGSFLVTLMGVRVLGKEGSPSLLSIYLKPRKLRKAPWKHGNQKIWFVIIFTEGSGACFLSLVCFFSLLSFRWLV